MISKAKKRSKKLILRRRTPSMGAEVPAVLYPVVVQDAATRDVLMLAYADAEALRRTRRTKSTWFYSRSRKRIWNKGATSGNTMRVLDVRWDCDRDALLYLVVPKGPACHTGAANCFGTDAFGIERLDSILGQRKFSGRKKSYTRRLLEDAALLDRKLMEEAFELTAARTNAEVAWEAADVMYFTLVKLRQKGVPLVHVLSELKRRHKLG